METYGDFDKVANRYTGLLGRFLKPNPQYNEIVDEMKLLIPNNLSRDAYVNWASSKKLETVPRILAYIFAIITIYKA